MNICLAFFVNDSVRVKFISSVSEPFKFQPRQFPNKRTVKSLPKNALNSSLSTKPE
jgi:hypothetical protein